MGPTLVHGTLLFKIEDASCFGGEERSDGPTKCKKRFFSVYYQGLEAGKQKHLSPDIVSRT